MSDHETMMTRLAELGDEIDDIGDMASIMRDDLNRLAADVARTVLGLRAAAKASPHHELNQWRLLMADELSAHLQQMGDERALAIARQFGAVP